MGHPVSASCRHQAVAKAHGGSDDAMRRRPRLYSRRHVPLQVGQRLRRLRPAGTGGRDPPQHLVEPSGELTLFTCRGILR